MSFDADPNESVTLSGADFAQMVAEMKTRADRIEALERLLRDADTARDIAAAIEAAAKAGEKP